MGGTRVDEGGRGEALLFHLREQAGVSPCHPSSA